jgi:agmatine deiminase
MSDDDGPSELRLESTAVSEFRQPAEWEPLEALWLAWPHHRETWPGRYDRLPPFFAAWIRRIAESTPVRLLASGDARKFAESMLGKRQDVEIVDVDTNDCWIRDYGPSFVIHRQDGRVHAVDWHYNAWGGKYPPWDKDQAAAKQICEALNIPRHASPLCLEGGALETDGGGRLLTTPGCLVTDTRNPGWTANDISRELYRRLGVSEIVWIDGGGLIGDDTDGHIDQLARFVDTANVVAAVCDDPSDPNRAALESNFRQLRLWGDQTQPRVHVHRLPIPPARHMDGQRVPESYCNFLRLGPQRLLVPTFSAATDDTALKLLSEISGVEAEAVDCVDLAWGLGALHCASRDQPAPQ